MKVSDFMSAKYLYMLGFWIGMFTSTREFLQVLGNRYLDSRVPRVRTDFGVFFFPVMLAEKGSDSSSFNLFVGKN